MYLNPVFSIIIPTYNRGHLIRKAISSILSQSYNQFELIVVDDGSTDNTEEVINSLADAKIKYIKTKNAERGAARNTGIKLACGQYITFLDSDDFLYNYHLSTSYNFIVEHNDPSAFHLGYEIINKKGKVLRKVNRLRNINSDLIKGNPLSCMGVFIKREVMIANLFNEDRELSGMEDWELWLRISSRFNFLACNRITSALVQHGDRSVLERDKEKLIKKHEKFCKSVIQIAIDPESIQSVLASSFTYTALHLAIIKATIPEIMGFLIAGVRKDFKEIFRRRTLVIFKLMALR